jgi:hypothetical protein
MALLLTCFKSLLHSVACKLPSASTASSKQPARCCAGMVRVPLLLCVAADVQLHTNCMQKQAEITARQQPD